MRIGIIGTGAIAPEVRELSMARRQMFPKSAPPREWVQILRELEGALS